MTSAKYGSALSILRVERTLIQAATQHLAIIAQLPAAFEHSRIVRRDSHQCKKGSLASTAGSEKEERAGGRGSRLSVEKIMQQQRTSQGNEYSHQNGDGISIKQIGHNTFKRAPVQVCTHGSCVGKRGPLQQHGAWTRRQISSILPYCKLPSLSTLRPSLIPLAVGR
jgi:hypothetical protein